MPVDLGRVERMILGQMNRIRSIGDLAVLLGASPETLRKDFSRGKGMPLSDYLTFERVAKAKELLRSTNLNCKEICYEVGFSREDVGAHVFKRLTGITMTQYRKCQEDNYGANPAQLKQMSLESLKKQ